MKKPSNNSKRTMKNVRRTPKGVVDNGKRGAK